MGARWNHMGAAAEYSFSFYEGFDHFRCFTWSRFHPPLGPSCALLSADADVRRGYGRAPVWATLKGEAGYFTSLTRSRTSIFSAWCNWNVHRASGS